MLAGVGAVHITKYVFFERNAREERRIKELEMRASLLTRLGTVYVPPLTTINTSSALRELDTAFERKDYVSMRHIAAELTLSGAEARSKLEEIFREVPMNYHPLALDLKTKEAVRAARELNAAYSGMKEYEEVKRVQE